MIDSANLLQFRLLPTVSEITCCPALSILHITANLKGAWGIYLNASDTGHISLCLLTMTVSFLVIVCSHALASFSTSLCYFLHPLNWGTSSVVLEMKLCILLLEILAECLVQPQGGRYKRWRCYNHQYNYLLIEERDGPHGIFENRV